MQTSTLGADDSGPNDTASIVIAIQQPLAGGTSTSLSVGIGSYTMESADADYAPQLVSKEAVTAGRTEWGRNDAMNKFAWTRPYEGTEYPGQPDTRVEPDGYSPIQFLQCECHQRIPGRLAVDEDIPA